MYLVDSYLPLRLARMLHALDVPVVHQLDRDKGGGTTDKDWVQLVRENGYILVSIDHTGRKDAPIALTLELGDITAVLLPIAFERLDRWGQASWLVKHWPKIDEYVGDAGRGLWTRITLSGKLEPYSASAIGK